MQAYIMPMIMAINNLVGIFIAIRLYNHIFDKKALSRIKRRIGYGLVFLFSLALNILFSNVEISLISAFSIFLILGIVFYNGKLHMKIIAAVFVVIFSFVTELITALILSIVFGDIMSHIRENLMLLFLGGIVSKLLLITLVEFIVRFRRPNASKVTLSSWFLIISIPIVSLVMSVTSVYEPILNNEFNGISIFACLSILYINVMTFYLFDSIVIQVHENNEYKFREEQLLMQRDQYESIIEGYNQVKKVRHDMIGHLISIEAYITNNQYEEVRAYLHKLNQELDFSKTGIISNNVVVDALINNRIGLAESATINFAEDILIPSKLKIDDMDLCIVVGNALNNAIEGCQRVEDTSHREINLKMRYKQNCLFIEVKNSYKKDSIRLKSDKFVSSKKFRKAGELGIGISHIETIVSMYGGTMEIELMENAFMTKIMMSDQLKNITVK